MQNFEKGVEKCKFKVKARAENMGPVVQIFKRFYWKYKCHYRHNQ